MKGGWMEEWRGGDEKREGRMDKEIEERMTDGSREVRRDG